LLEERHIFCKYVAKVKVILTSVVTETVGIDTRVPFFLHCCLRKYV